MTWPKCQPTSKWRLSDVSRLRPMPIFAVSEFCVRIYKPLEQLKMAALRTVVLLVFLSSCLASKFAMIPMFGRSHFMLVAKLGQELAERGHEVCNLRWILLCQLVSDIVHVARSLTMWRLKEGKKFTGSVFTGSGKYGRITWKLNLSLKDLHGTTRHYDGRFACYGCTLGRMAI